MVRYTDTQIIELIHKHFAGKRIQILSPLLRGEKVITGNCLNRSASKGIPR
jgi:hypothetical protein